MNLAVKINFVRHDLEYQFISKDATIYRICRIPAYWA